MFFTFDPIFSFDPEAFWFLLLLLLLAKSAATLLEKWFSFVNGYQARKSEGVHSVGVVAGIGVGEFVYLSCREEVQFWTCPHFKTSSRI